MLVRRCQHPDLKRLKAPHLLLQHRYLVFQPRRLGRPRQRRLLPVGAVQLVQIALNTFLDLLHAPLHFGPREVSVPGVDRLELAAIEVAAVGDDIKPVCLQNSLGLLGHVGELRTVGAHVGHLMGDDQMMLGVH